MSRHRGDPAEGGEPDDLGLLRIQIGANWPLDGAGRLCGAGAPLLVIASAMGGQVAAVVGETLPAELAEELVATAVEGAAQPEPGLPPGGLGRCRELLNASVGPVGVISGPSWLVPPDVAFAAATAGTTAEAAQVLRSDLAAPAELEALRAANPGNWPAEEWNTLLDGESGPWAMALDRGRVVSICHTPVSSTHGAEAGTWTASDFRGRGLAAATTAAWAHSAEHGGRQRLFYSTTAGNNSSRRVAERLRLRPIGWLRKISPRD